MFNLNPAWHLGYPNFKHLFDMLVFLITDSMHFTRHWFQYCHPTLVCKRKSHAYAFFFFLSQQQKCINKTAESLEFFFFCSVFERENKTHCSADCRLGNLDRQIYSGTPTADQLHHSCELLGQVLNADVADIVRPGCTADSIIPKRSVCLCHYITESWAVWES